MSQHEPELRSCLRPGGGAQTLVGSSTCVGRLVGQRLPCSWASVRLTPRHPALGCFLLSRHLLETPPPAPPLLTCCQPASLPRSCRPVTRRPTPRPADSWSISPWPELPEEGVCTASPARGATSGLQSELESLSQQIRVEAGLGPNTRDALGAPLPGSLSALPGPPTPAPEEEGRWDGQAPAPPVPQSPFPDSCRVVVGWGDLREAAAGVGAGRGAGPGEPSTAAVLRVSVTVCA